MALSQAGETSNTSIYFVAFSFSCFCWSVGVNLFRWQCIHPPRACLGELDEDRHPACFVLTWACSANDDAPPSRVGCTLSNLKKAQRLLGLTWDIVLLDSNAANAKQVYEQPRRLFVHKPLVNEVCQNDAELAMVIGNVVSHSIFGHEHEQQNIKQAVMSTQVVLLTMIDPTGQCDVTAPHAPVHLPTQPPRHPTRAPLSRRHPDAQHVYAAGRSCLGSPPIIRVLLLSRWHPAGSMLTTLTRALSMMTSSLPGIFTAVLETALLGAALGGVVESYMSGSQDIEADRVALNIVTDAGR